MKLLFSLKSAAVCLVFTTSISCHRQVIAFSSSNNNNHNKTPPPPPRQTPDERQAAMLEKMGYTWNGQAWIRGNLDAYYKAQRAVARSSNRCIQFVNSNNSMESTSSPAAVAASKRFQEVLSKSRQDAMSQTNEQRARDRDFKNFLQTTQAPFVWLGAQLVCLVALSHVTIGNGVSIDWSSEFEKFMNEPLFILSLGLVAGVVLSSCRAESRSLLPGVEELDGKLERILADAMDGNFALPAPNDIRYTGNNWKLFCTLGETIAAINVSVLMNGLLQPALIRISSDALVWRLVSVTSDVPVGQHVALVGAWGAALAVALPAAIRVSQGATEPFDGIPAEVEGVLRAKQTAGAYFNMNVPKDVDPIETTKAFQVLAQGWIETFGGVTEGVVWKQPVLAYAGSLACAMVWQLSGGALVAPCIARVFAATVTYLVLDEEESCRASVPLPASEERDD